MSTLFSAKATAGLPAIALASAKPLAEPGSAAAGEFPLRSSLFWMNNGKVDSTWRYLARNCSDADRQAMVAWQVAHGMNTMIFLTYARGGDCVVNPFVQTYGPDVDWAEASRWLELLAPGKSPGVNLVPCLFCDDDPETARNEKFQNYYVPAACVALGKYSRAICIGLEMSEQFSRIGMERIIALCKQYTDKPIGVHLQWDRKSALPSGLDFLIYEHPWHPKDGDNHSAAEVASIGADVIAKSGLPVWFNEYNWNVEGQRIREQTRALAQLAGCVGVGGPLK